MSPDEVVRRYLDDVDVPGDWDKLGIVPEELENVAITYVRRYRNACVSLLECCNRFGQLVLIVIHCRTNYARPVKLPARDGGSSAVRSVISYFNKDTDNVQSIVPHCGLEQALYVDNAVTSAGLP